MYINILYWLKEREQESKQTQQSGRLQLHFSKKDLKNNGKFYGYCQMQGGKLGPL